MLFEDNDDLFFGKSYALHLGSSLGQSYTEIPQTGWIGLRGKDQAGSNRYTPVIQDNQSDPRQLRKFIIGQYTSTLTMLH